MKMIRFWHITLRQQNKKRGRGSRRVTFAIILIINNIIFFYKFQDLRIVPLVLRNDGGSNYCYTLLSSRRSTSVHQ